MQTFPMQFIIIIIIIIMHFIGVLVYFYSILIILLKYGNLIFRFIEIIKPDRYKIEEKVAAVIPW